MGETRETRLREFHEVNAAVVVAIREGAVLQIEGPSMHLRGATGGVLFRRGQARVELAPGADLSALLQTARQTDQAPRPSR